MMDSGENSPVTLVCDVNVELTQWCFKEKKDVSSALETVFESCRSKGNAKVRVRWEKIISEFVLSLFYNRLLLLSRPPARPKRLRAKLQCQKNKYGKR